MTGLTLTEQRPADVVATITLDGRAPAEVWQALASTESFCGKYVNAIRDAGHGREYLEYHDVLKDADIGALNTAGEYGSLRSLTARVARGDARAMWSLLRELKRPGTGKTPLEDAYPMVRIFALALENQPDRDIPTVVVETTAAFREQRADQRRQICGLLTELAAGVNVTIVGTGLTRRWLLETHREDLPVSAECNTSGPENTPSALAERATGEIDPDSREVSEVLRPLADETTETLSYSALYSSAMVQKSRIRQCISRLEGLGLVATFNTQTGRSVELLEAGREYLSRVSRQSTLKGCVSDPGKSHPQTRGTPATRVGEEDGGPYRTTVQQRADQAAVTACAADSDVCLVQEPQDPDETAEHRRTKAVYYDEDREQVTVSVHAGGGLPYLVSVATALATPWFLDRTLTDDHLETINEPAAILRGARNIGGLSDRSLEDPDDLRGTLSEWGQTIEELTTKLSRANGDDKSALGTEIMRSSHGLAGSIVHLLDAVGIDVIRDIRVPGGRESADLEQLAESLTRSALIQSKYGVFAPYRHLLETDAGEPSITPEVDAADPHGKLIGSFVLRGSDIHRLREPLEARLSSPGEILEDAPEITVPITVSEAGRPEIATAVTRTLQNKNIRPTREAVSILHALSGNPFDVAWALNQLESEETPREIRADELRYALSALEADHLTPELSPTVGKVLSSLLQADERLSQRDLADRAGVSTRSIRNNRDVLEALGLVSVDGNGWRLKLSFRTDAERRGGIVPDIVGTPFVDAVGELLEMVLPPERYGDPDDPVGGTLFWPPEPWVLLENPDVAPWVKLTAQLTGTERPNRKTSIDIGPTLEQQPLTALEEVTV